MSSYKKIRVILELEVSKPKDEAIYQLFSGVVTLLKASNYYKGIKYKTGYIEEKFIEDKHE